MAAPLSNFPSPQCSRSRRARRSAAARKPVLHVVMPGIEVARAVPRARETVAAFLRRTAWAMRDPEYGWRFRKGLPTICEINGEPVLRKEWCRRRITANDNVRFVSSPLGNGQGGNSGVKQVIGLVALVAVAAFAAFASGGGLVPLLGSAFAEGSFGALAASAGIGSGGSLFTNSLGGNDVRY